MTRCLLALLVGAALCVAPLIGADPHAKPDPATNKTPADIKNEAALKEMLIAQRYRDFEQHLLRLAQRLEKSSKAEDRDKAKQLKEALETAGKSGINTRFEKLIALLRESKATNLAEVKEAIDHGERLVKDMREMLALITKDGDIEKNKALQKRLAELIKALEALIRNQKLVRVHTEKESMPKDELRKGQDKVRDNTDNFAKDMEDKNQPGHDRLPGKDLVRDAVKDQGVASANIAASNKDGASDSQSAAIDKLVKVRDALDKLLKQLREEELKAILASLQARCELMLAMQIEVQEGTLGVAKAVKTRDGGKAAAEDHRKSSHLAGREGNIVSEADQAIRIVKEEGSANAFLEVFQQLRLDMANVQRRLDKTDAGTLTLNLEQDIIDTLKEMIEALKKAQQPGGGGGGGGGGNPNANGDLVDKLAQLKMIRSMQMKVNKRTELIGKQFDGEQPDELDLRRDLRELGERQSNIQQVTRDIATEKNK